MAGDHLTAPAGTPAQARVDAYLAELAQLLRGPRRHRARILAELRDGLDHAIGEQLGAGRTGDQAVSAAIEEFGTPQALADAFAGELATGYARHTIAWYIATGPLVGAWWLKRTQGHYFTDDPKLIWSLVVWAAYAVMVFAHGRWLAAASNAGAILVWDTATGAVSQTLQRLAAPAQRLAFSPQCAAPPEAPLEPCAHVLASAHPDNVLRLWSVPGGSAPLAALPGHTDRVTALAFSPDGRALASTGWDGRARITWPGTGVRAEIDADAPLRHLILYTPAGKPFFAVEPVSNANNGFNLLAAGVPDSGVEVLEAGAALRTRFRIRISPTNRARP